MRTSSKRFWHGCLWGLVATLALTVTMLLAWRIWPNAIPAPLPLAVTVGIVARVFGTQPMTPIILVLGTILQFAYGAFWGGLLEITSSRPAIWKSIALALGLWLMMVIFYMPMAGIDTFEVATSPGVWLATLIGHLIYGYTLGRLLIRDERRLPSAADAIAVTDQ